MPILGVGIGDRAGFSRLWTERHARPDEVAYTFDHFGELVHGLLDELGVGRYAMYVMDYGALVGWRLR